MDLGLKGKVAIVGGASMGIGYGIARTLAMEGAHVVITARRDAGLAKAAEALQADALKAGSAARIFPIAADCRRADDCTRVVAATITEFGGIDVLVNNAGYGYSAAIEEGEDVAVRAMFETNFFGLIAVTKRVLPLMRAHGRGHVINISSIGGLVGSPSSGYYNASKFAVEGLSQALQAEVGPLGIRVTLIEPGPFRTDFQGRSMTATKSPLDAYAGTAGARRAQQKTGSGKQAGDPVRAADAIIEVARSPNPPLHLLLGRNALERARAKYRDVLRSMDEWEKVTLSADFPEA